MNKTTLNSQKEKYSMLSLRRATHSGQMPSWPGFDFYPRSPCGERQYEGGELGVDVDISIHALLAESDVENTDTDILPVFISIHALLAESDIGRA